MWIYRERLTSCWHTAIHLQLGKEEAVLVNSVQCITQISLPHHQDLDHLSPKLPNPLCVYRCVSTGLQKYPFTKLGLTIATIVCVSAEGTAGIIIKSTKHASLEKATNPTATPTLSSLELTSKAWKEAEENWIEEAKADAEDVLVHSSWHGEHRQHGCCSELLTKKLGERRMPSIRSYSAVVVATHWIFFPELRRFSSSQEAHVKC